MKVINRDRLNLCQSFANAKTIEEIKKEKAQKARDDYWEEQRKKEAIRRFLNAWTYQKRP